VFEFSCGQLHIAACPVGVDCTLSDPIQSVDILLEDAKLFLLEFAFQKNTKKKRRRMEGEIAEGPFPVYLSSQFSVAFCGPGISLE